MADLVHALRKLALSLLDVVETTACAGTALEQSSYRTGGKAFLFAQRKGELAVVRLKLGPSLGAAQESPDGVEVGKGGWTTCRLPIAMKLTTTLAEWVRESHRLFAGEANARAPSKKKRAPVKKKRATKRS